MRRLYSLMAILAAVSMLAPTVAMADQKELNPDGSIPKQYNLPKPTAEYIKGSIAAVGNGDGSNNLSFANFGDGDIVVGLGTPTGHTGEWDARESRGLDTKCIWSANTTPYNGVQLESPNKYRGYDYAYGLWVPRALRAKRAVARSYCAAQKGEPYNILSSKSDTSQWYCSKLVWKSYKEAADIDVDGDGGPMVAPIDLVIDGDTSIFAKAN